jgi:Zn-dependent protease/predicted transcriptional regulator
VARFSDFKELRVAKIIMKWSLYIGKISGIKLFIHWTFFFLILWIIYSGMKHGKTIPETLLSVGFFCTVFICVMLHEFGHALTAKYFNFKTLDITLLPIGGMARMESLPDKPFQEFLVAIMGPAVNLVISLILFIFLQSNNLLSFGMFTAEVTKWNFWSQLFAVNIFLALFNLIPAFPMDGGRIFRALLSIKLSRSQATDIAASAGQIISVIFIILGIAYNPLLAFIGLFIFLTAKGEAKMEEARAALGDLKVKDILMHQYTELHPEDPLSKAVSLMLDSQEKSFIVTEQDEVKGILSSKEIIDGLAKYGDNDIPVHRVMKKNIISLDEEENIRQVMQKFSVNPQMLLPVLKENKLKGVLNLENINEFIQIRLAMKDALKRS